MVQAPELCNRELSFNLIKEHFNKNFLPGIEEKIKKYDEKYKGINIDFDFFAKKRNVSHITQFV